MLTGQVYNVNVKLNEQQLKVIGAVVPSFDTSTKNYFDWRQLIFDIRKEQKKYAKLAKKTSKQQILDLEMNLEAVYFQVAKQLPSFVEVERHLNG